MLEAVKARGERAGVFGPVTLDAAKARLSCAAAASAAPAEYRVDVQDQRLWVSLVTADRWLSQSIEQDLVHTGDKLEELIEEELVDLDYEVRAATVSYEHFRSPDKLFTFRSEIPVTLDRVRDPQAAEVASKWLLAYEACFRRLGDMEGGDDDE